MTRANKRKLRMLAENGCTPKQCARELGVTRGQVLAVAADLRLQLTPDAEERTAHHIPSKMQLRMRELRKGGMKQREVAALLQVSESTVNRACRGHLEHRRAVTAGEIEKAKKMREEGMYWKDIGAALGRAKSSIRRAVEDADKRVREVPA